MRKARVIMVAAGACGVIIAAGGATAALASIPSSSGVIHGCYGPAGFLRVTSGTTCPSGQKTLSWNQTGPAGPPGPAGPGLSTTIVEGSDSTAGVGSFETASVACPAAYPNAIGGGYVIDNTPQTAPTDYAVVFDMPANSNQWWVRIAVPANAPADVTWLVRAVCAK
jgi:hypothetical protein